MGSRYFGKPCAVHPELKGERSRANSHKCVGCERERDRRRRTKPARLAKERARDRRRDHIRRAQKRGARVPLTSAEHLRINALYAEAVRRTAETGIVHHVDHDVPLALGGKHHPDNLLIVPAAINLAKGARHASTWDFISS